MSLEDASDITRDPSAIEIAHLGDNLLSVDVAVPRSCIEREVSSDRFECLCRLVIRPYPVVHRLQDGRRAHDGVIRRYPLPLARRRPLGGRDGEPHGTRW